MRGDEGRAGMMPEEIVTLRQQFLEGRELGLRIASPRKERQLEPALVGVILWMKEFARIRGVDEDREMQARTRVPHGIEIGIVDAETRAVALPVVQAERLGDLADADRPRGHVRLELPHRAVRPAGADVAEVDSREHAHLE